MDRDVRADGKARHLFRAAAVRAAAGEVFGRASIALPAFAPLALAMALLSACCLAAAAALIQVPVSARVAGLIEPSGGFVDAVANRPGRIAAIHVGEGRAVVAGQALMDVASAASDLAGRDVSARSLASLGRERELAAALHAARSEALARQRRAVQSERDIVAALGTAAAEQLRLQRHLRDGDSARVVRLRQLRADGYASADDLASAEASTTRLAAEVVQADAARLQALLEAARLDDLLGSLEDRAAELAAEFDVADERFGREIEAARQAAGERITAPDAGIVARLLVQEGAAVSAGQPVLRLQRSLASCEARLFLPGASALPVRAGQRVELQIHAYPVTLHGTQAAEVLDVSRAAFPARDLALPLALEGPVFEIRARLVERCGGTIDARLALRPGMTFTAALVPERVPLYAWLLRLLAGGGTDGA